MLHLPEIPWNIEQHYRNISMKLRGFRKERIFESDPRHVPGDFRRRERSRRATGQPSSQIILRPASLIEKHYLKSLPGWAHGV